MVVALVAFGKKTCAFGCQSVHHLRASYRFRTAPGIHVTAPLKLVAVLFHAHVTKLQAFAEFIDRESLRLLESFQ